jgi:hypothetical protein
VKRKNGHRNETYHTVATGRDGREVDDGDDVGAEGVGIALDGALGGGTVALGFVPNGTERKMST